MIAILASLVVLVVLLSILSSRQKVTRVIPLRVHTDEAPPQE
jgi:hypothetical protein